MAKEEKRCKECQGMGDECKCPKKSSKSTKGSYGLGRETGYGYDDDHQNPDDVSGSSEGGGMSESLAQSQTRKAAAETKSLAKFKEKAEAAKKRQSEKDALHNQMRSDRKTKGIRFSDARGKGYIKDGKKTYDA